MPKYIYFEGFRCPVVAWLDAVVCFEMGGQYVWRDQTAVTLKKR